VSTVARGSARCALSCFLRREIAAAVYVQINPRRHTAGARTSGEGCGGGRVSAWRVYKPPRATAEVMATNISRCRNGIASVYAAVVRYTSTCVRYIIICIIIACAKIAPHLPPSKYRCGCGGGTGPARTHTYQVWARACAYESVCVWWWWWWCRTARISEYINHILSLRRDVGLLMKTLSPSHAAQM